MLLIAVDEIPYLEYLKILYVKFGVCISAD